MNRVIPVRRLPPRPRPDFAVLKGGQVILLLDARYRDLWERETPAIWLYQLAVYASSSQGGRFAKIMYPTTTVAAKLQV
jgi:5-methylcytosine-specific restriction enzyme subunit McrC